MSLHDVGGGHPGAQGQLMQQQQGQQQGGQGGPPSDIHAQAEAAAQAAAAQHITAAQQAARAAFETVYMNHNVQTPEIGPHGPVPLRYLVPNADNTDLATVCAIANCEHPATPGCLHCRTHGGRRRCDVPLCKKFAQAPTTKCKSHGGGYRCKAPTCTKSAAGGVYRCEKHQDDIKHFPTQAPTTARTCTKGTCAELAVVAVHLCKNHGGGKRCAVEDCNRTAVAHSECCLQHNNIDNLKNIKPRPGRKRGRGPPRRGRKGEEDFMHPPPMGEGDDQQHYYPYPPMQGNPAYPMPYGYFPFMPAPVHGQFQGGYFMPSQGMYPGGEEELKDGSKKRKKAKKSMPMQQMPPQQRGPGMQMPKQGGHPDPVM